MVRAFVRAWRDERCIVELFKEVLHSLGWSVRVHCEVDLHDYPRVVFANLNQLGHAGAIGVAVAMDKVWPRAHTPFVVNLGWKLFPLVGWLCEWRYTIVLQLAGQGKKVMNRVALDLQNGAISSVEGNRAKHLTDVAPFRKGCAHLAIDTATVIVPVIFSDSCYHAWPHGKMLPVAKPTVLEFHFLAPIDCIGRTAEDVTRQLQTIMTNHTKSKQ